MTFYPLLVFPALFEEKTAAAVRQARRQARIYAASRELLAEEASEAYKDVADVVRVSDGAGLTRQVARLRPLAVVKG